MPLPALAWPAAAAAAPWLIRKFVQYVGGPFMVGLAFMLKTRLGLFIATAFVWLGINFTTVTLVVEPAINLLRGATENVGTGGIGPFAAAAGAYMGILQFDRAITMVISAVVTHHAMSRGEMLLRMRNPA